MILVQVKATQYVNKRFASLGDNNINRLECLPSLINVYEMKRIVVKLEIWRRLLLLLLQTKAAQPPGLFQPFLSLSPLKSS